MTTTPGVTLTRIDAHSWQIARGDERKPQAYQVALADGTVIGVVRNQSSESWRKSRRIRTSLIGYAHNWRYTPASEPNERPGTASTRQSAVQVLVEIAASSQQEARHA